MRLLQNNHAYIDAANLHLGVRNLGWKLDYKKFRIWLKERHSVEFAFMFIGYVSRYETLYTELRNAGFILVFKETVSGDSHPVKGNCDADLVLRVAVDTFEEEYDEAVIVSGDGDFSTLLSFLIKRKRLKTLISPDNDCSRLLRQLNPPFTYLNSIRSYVEKPS